MGLKAPSWERYLLLLRLRSGNLSPSHWPPKGKPAIVVDINIQPGDLSTSWQRGSRPWVSWEE